MKRAATFIWICACLSVTPLVAQEPVEVGFLWHMHQPTYRPGQTIVQTENSGAFSFSLFDVHNQRLGPYTGWPRDAIQSGLGLPNLGASVSFSGSLIRNLDDLEAAGINGGQWNNWHGAYQQAAGWQTSLGNRRLDLVNFGFNHPLMPLLDRRDIEMQIRLQKLIHSATFPGVPYSKGIFPPETAFSTRMIPALVSQGIEWVIVDSIHVERATVGYPHTNNSGLFQPNKADQVNAALESQGSQWVNLTGLWSPSAVAARFAYQPHYVQHVDPETGQVMRLIMVPGARYEGNEDARGGFGALQYETVFEQYRQLNTDADHPMLVLLHHDGDNFGGGAESYYHGNFNNMVNWATGNANYNVTTIQDYLDRFPVAVNDLVHVENGAWAGADNGDPEFKKWLGDPGQSGFSPDRNSWAVLTAARNRVFTADDIAPATNLGNIINGLGTETERAWHTLLQAEGSDHWYWDGQEVWDSNVTLGSNLAVSHADTVIASYSGTETTPPTIFVPQREPYNPGGLEFGSSPEPSDFEVWTFAYDVSGLQSVTLKFRVDADGLNPLTSIQNETYAGGAEVGDWMDVPMTSSDVIPPANILSPTYRALRYRGMIEGYDNVLIDYYVEAVDGNGVVSRSDIQHVYVGNNTGGPGGERVVITPDPAIAGDDVTIEYDPVGGPLNNASMVYLHYGINGWSTIYNDVQMNWDSARSAWTVDVPVASTAMALDMVFNNGSGTWDNNNGQDWHFQVDGAAGDAFQMDGQLDASAQLASSNNGQHLYYAVSPDGQLYVATEDAGEGSDTFVYVALSPGAPVPANWAKAGSIAAWDGYLADENDNNFHAWFDIAGQSATGPNGGVLEGVIDLAAVYGVVPTSIRVAVGRYQTQDGGALLPQFQVPASLDNDGNIQAGEWLEIDLATVTTVPVESFQVTRGNLVAGGLAQLASSDNVDVSSSRAIGDIQSRVFLTFSGTSPAEFPASIQFSVESSVFARSQVNLAIDLYNFEIAGWEEVHAGVASQFMDSIVAVQATGDLSRFVQPVTNQIEARCRYESVNQRQQFTANVDHVFWEIGR
jgi:hypothetical protein